jgi:hypothetical protein
LELERSRGPRAPSRKQSDASSPPRRPSSPNWGGWPRLQTRSNWSLVSISTPKLGHLSLPQAQAPTSECRLPGDEGEPCCPPESALAREGIAIDRRRSAVEGTVSGGDHESVTGCWTFAGSAACVGRPQRDSTRTTPSRRSPGRAAPGAAGSFYAPCFCTASERLGTTPMAGRSSLIVRRCPDRAPWGGIPGMPAVGWSPNGPPVRKPELGRTRTARQRRLHRLVFHRGSTTISPGPRYA